MTFGGFLIVNCIGRPEFAAKKIPFIYVVAYILLQKDVCVIMLMVYFHDIKMAKGMLNNGIIFLQMRLQECKHWVIIGWERLLAHITWWSWL